MGWFRVDRKTRQVLVIDGCKWDLLDPPLLDSPTTTFVLAKYDHAVARSKGWAGFARA